MKETCYACIKTATTREHVPPACLFPEGKDLGAGYDLRMNLITVPSCDDHNTIKSGDDEYLLWILSTNLTANSTGQKNALTKLARSYKRKPALDQSFFMKAKETLVKESHSEIVHETLEIEFDGNRFQKALEFISLGIYRHHYGKRWVGRLRVHPDFIAFPYEKNSAEIDENRVVFYNAAQQLFAVAVKHGDNPDVFWYQLSESQELLECAIRFAFYGQCTVTAMFGLI